MVRKAVAVSGLKRSNARALFGLVCAALAGGAALADDSQTELPETKLIRGRADCFNISQLRDFEFLDDRNLVVFERRQRAFHVELFSSCINLQNAFGLEFRGHVGRVCGTAGDAVVARDLLGREDEFERPCLVRRVRALDEEDLYELSIITGKVAPPPPIGAAEIEVVQADAPPGAPEVSESKE